MSPEPVPDLIPPANPGEPPRELPTPPPPAPLLPGEAQIPQIDGVTNA